MCGSSPATRRLLEEVDIVFNISNIKVKVLSHTFRVRKIIDARIKFKNDTVLALKQSQLSHVQNNQILRISKSAMHICEFFAFTLQNFVTSAHHKRRCFCTSVVFHVV